MIKLFWDEQFKRDYKKWKTQHPDLINQFSGKLSIFGDDPFSSSLKTHLLKGKLHGLWSFSVTYEYRVLFEFINKEKTEVLLIKIGTHDQVY